MSGTDGRKDDGIGVRDLAWATVASPLGEIAVACSDTGVARVRLDAPSPPPGPPAVGHVLLADAARQLGEYFSGGRRSFDLPVDLSGVSPAAQRVLTVLAGTVGYGQTITYGALAARAGLEGGGSTPPARLVGRIMGSNPCPVIVPCHRVVAGGGLGGYSGGAGVETKRWLLTFEGAIPPTLDFAPGSAAH